MSSGFTVLTLSYSHAFLSFKPISATNQGHIGPHGDHRGRLTSLRKWSSRNLSRRRRMSAWSSCREFLLPFCRTVRDRVPVSWQNLSRRPGPAHTWVRPAGGVDRGFGGLWKGHGTFKMGQDTLFSTNTERTLLREENTDECARCEQPSGLQHQLMRMVKFVCVEAESMFPTANSSQHEYEAVLYRLPCNTNPYNVIAINDCNNGGLL